MSTRPGDIARDICRDIERANPARSQLIVKDNEILPSYGPLNDVKEDFYKMQIEARAVVKRGLDNGSPFPIILAQMRHNRLYLMKRKRNFGYEEVTTWDIGHAWQKKETKRIGIMLRNKQDESSSWGVAPLYRQISLLPPEETSEE